MRNRRKNSGLSAALFGATGWLFADLLLALAMMFLLAEPSGQYIVGPPTPTPQVICTPVPTPLAALNLTPISFPISIDYIGILNNDPAAVASAQQEVRRQMPQGAAQHAGLVEIYGGAAGYSAGGAITLARAFRDNVLIPLGEQGFVFYPTNVVVYQPLLSLDQPPSVMTLDIFNFRPPPAVTPAPNSTCATATP